MLDPSSRDCISDMRKHSWNRKWDYNSPSNPTDDLICGRCHLTWEGAYVPDLEDPIALLEWLDG